MDYYAEDVVPGLTWDPGEIASDIVMKFFIFASFILMKNRGLRNSLREVYE